MSNLSGKILKRSEIDDKFKWNPHHIFETEESFLEALTLLQEKGVELGSYRGTLGSNGNLLTVINLHEEASTLLKNLMVYTNCLSDVDKRDAKYQNLTSRVSALYVEFSSALSYLEPEIAALGANAQKLVKNTAYVHFIDEILRLAKHTLSEKEEYLLSLAGEVAEAPERAFSMLENADMKYGSITLDGGDEVEITNGRFINLMESESPRVRRETFAHYYGAFEAHKNTIASLLNSHNLKNKFIKTARKYDSCLEMCIAGNNIPKSVYMNLIESVEAALPKFYDYVALRKKLLGLETLHMYDMYTPIVKNTFKNLSYDDAKALVLKALAPLGAEYVSVIQRAYDEGWIDVYESEGKISGAYSNGNASCHPYILLNHTNNLDSAFTLAHELGHAMHSYFSNREQPEVYKGYGIFVAEVASTVNEALLNAYLMSNTTEPDELKYIYNHYLESFRGTLFRQTMFAKFELLTHEIVEQGEGLTPDLLSEKYGEMVAKYFGEGIVEGLVIDPEIKLEWARIPHFYYDFYVYQYSTGFASAQAIAANILDGKDIANYLKFLSTGSALPPLDALKIAGVDLTTPAPIVSATELFGEAVTRLAKLCE